MYDTWITLRVTRRGMATHPHEFMSCINESRPIRICHVTCGWVESFMRMSHHSTARWVTTHPHVTWQIRMGRDSFMYDMTQVVPTNGNWVMSHIWVSHATHLNTSCHKYQWDKPYLWMTSDWFVCVCVLSLKKDSPHGDSWLSHTPFTETGSWLSHTTFTETRMPMCSMTHYSYVRRLFLKGQDSFTWNVTNSHRTWLIHTWHKSRRVSCFPPGHPIYLWGGYD